MPFYQQIYLLSRIKSLNLFELEKGAYFGKQNFCDLSLPEFICRIQAFKSDIYSVLQGLIKKENLCTTYFFYS
jgi:hypothetical protein